jgi:hypothetical protein
MPSTYGASSPGTGNLSETKPPDSPKSLLPGGRGAISVALTPNKDTKRSGVTSAEIVASPDAVGVTPTDMRISRTCSTPLSVRHSGRSRI